MRVEKIVSRFALFLGAFKRSNGDLGLSDCL